MDFSFEGPVTVSSSDIVSVESGGDLDVVFGGAGSFMSSASGLISIGNSIATLGGLIDDVLTALMSLQTQGSSTSQSASVWAAANITPIMAKWRQVFDTGTGN
jgi:hypothetical protein